MSALLGAAMGRCSASEALLSSRVFEGRFREMGLAIVEAGPGSIWSIELGLMLSAE